jgi:hypothetical protein
MAGLAGAALATPYGGIMARAMVGLGGSREDSDFLVSCSFRHSEAGLKPTLGLMKFCVGTHCSCWMGESGRAGFGLRRSKAGAHANFLPDVRLLPN